MEASRTQPLGLAAVMLTVALWGTSAVAIKAVSTTGLVTATYRLWFAVPVLVASLMLPSVRRRLDRQWLVACLVGGSLFAVHQSLYCMSLKLTSVTDVTMIGALQPALVLLLAGPLFGEAATLWSVVWSAVAFVGTMLVMLGSDHSRASSFVGDALSFVNLFAFTTFFLASKRFRERVHAWDYVAGMTTVSAVIIVTLALATHQDFGAPKPWEWAVLVWLALVPGTGGHLLTNWAHAHVPAFVSSMILLAVPIVAAFAAHALVAEPISPLQIAGGSIVIVAIAAIIRPTRPTRTREDRQIDEVVAEASAFTEAP